MKYLRALAGAALLGLIGTFGMVQAQTPGTGPNVYNGGFYQSPFYSLNGHFQFGGAMVPPTVSACGTGPGTVFGTDTAFNFVTGTSASGACTITPTVAYAKRPSCSAEGETSTAPSITVSNSGVITLGAVQDATRYYILCFAQPGGL